MSRPKGHPANYQQKGRNNGKAKLNEGRVKQIFIWYAQGMPQKEIGRLLGVSQKTVSDVLHGKLWGHVKENYLKGSL